MGLVPFEYEIFARIFYLIMCVFFLITGITLV